MNWNSKDSLHKPPFCRWCWFFLIDVLCPDSIAAPKEHGHRTLQKICPKDRLPKVLFSHCSQNFCEVVKINQPMQFVITSFTWPTCNPPSATVKNTSLPSNVEAPSGDFPKIVHRKVKMNGWRMVILVAWMMQLKSIGLLKWVQPQISCWFPMVQWNKPGSC